MDIRELDRRAMDVTAGIVALVAAEQLNNPTPCAGWLVRDLLAHIIGQYHGFALAASGQPTTVEDFLPRPVTTDWVSSYTSAAVLVTESFAEPGVLDRRFHLPEIRDGGSFPAGAAIGFHLVDEVAHAWDLANSIGVPVEFEERVLAAALSISLQVPNDSASRGAGFAFAPAETAEPGLATLDRIVALLGRRPDWTSTPEGQLSAQGPTGDRRAVRPDGRAVRPPAG
jgi:uncharacterized protein (TIGR03086 family)